LYTSVNQDLAKAVISKLTCVLEGGSRDGDILISSRVDEGSMIYYVVEIIKDNNAVKCVNIRQLDT
jgi:hypothetical protein